MVLVISGATGQVGKELVQCLQKNRINNRLLMRDPEKASFLQHPCSELVAFDYTRPQTYEAALKGVERLFLVCDSSIAYEPIANFLKAAKSFNVKHVVVMSGIGADKVHDHFLSKLEVLVKEANLPHTALRANWFFQNFSSYFIDMVSQAHELVFPDGGASLSFVDTRDIADVAYFLLTIADLPTQEAYTITGPESLTHAEVADLFSKHLPFKVHYKQISEQEAKDSLQWNDELLLLFRDIRNGITAPISADVEKLLGKPGRKLEDYIIENRAIWTTKATTP